MRERLAEEIIDLDVDISRSSFHGRGSILAAKIDSVHSVNITSLNVLEQQDQTFTCEPEIEAEISLEIDVEIEGRWPYSGPDDYEPSPRLPDYRDG